MHRLRYIWKHRILKIPYRIKYGFWPSDLWNLDVELAKWLGTRLVKLSEETDGYPRGYEGKHFGWTGHMRFHGVSLSAYANNRDEFNTDEEEREYMHYADQAMQWVAKWWASLWW